MNVLHLLFLFYHEDQKAMPREVKSRAQGRTGMPHLHYPKLSTSRPSFPQKPTPGVQQNPSFSITSTGCTAQDNLLSNG